MLLELEIMLALELIPDALLQRDDVYVIVTLELVPMVREMVLQLVANVEFQPGVDQSI